MTGKRVSSFPRLSASSDRYTYEQAMNVERLHMQPRECACNRQLHPLHDFPTLAHDAITPQKPRFRFSAAPGAVFSTRGNKAQISNQLISIVRNIHPLPIRRADGVDEPLRVAPLARRDEPLRRRRLLRVGLAAAAAAAATRLHRRQQRRDALAPPVAAVPDERAPAAEEG